MEKDSVSFAIDFLSEYSEEALISELRRVAAQLPAGTPLTRTSYESLSPRTAVTTLRRKFGGWQQALEKAGLSHLYNGRTISEKMRSKPGRGLTKADVVSELRRVQELAGTAWLTTDLFNTHSSFEEGTIRSHVGSFRKGLEAAGIASHPLAHRQLSDEECFNNLAVVWTHHARIPAYRELFQSPSHVQGKTYVTRWGTWRKALSAFVEWTNSDTRGVSGAETTIEDTSVVPLGKRPQLNEADRRDIRPGLRFNVFKRDRFRCVVCGRAPATQLNIELHADHILAIANGGKTTFENLQTLCQDCNLGKGKKLFALHASTQDQNNAL